MKIVTDRGLILKPVEQAIAIVLTKQDKKNIANMGENTTVYAVAPENYDSNDLEVWINAIKKAYGTTKDKESEVE